MTFTAVTNRQNLFLFAIVFGFLVLKWGYLGLVFGAVFLLPGLAILQYTKLGDEAKLALSFPVSLMVTSGLMFSLHRAGLDMPVGWFAIIPIAAIGILALNRYKFELKPGSKEQIITLVVFLLFLNLFYSALQKDAVPATDGSNHLYKTWVTLQGMEKYGKILEWSKYMYSGHTLFMFYPPLAYVSPAMLTHFAGVPVHKAFNFFAFWAILYAGIGVYFLAKKAAIDEPLALGATLLERTNCLPLPAGYAFPFRKWLQRTRRYRKAHKWLHARLSTAIPMSKKATVALLAIFFMWLPLVTAIPKQSAGEPPSHLKTFESVGELGMGVVSMTVYDGKLYAGSESGNVYRYDGGTTWTEIGRYGSNSLSSLVVYNGKLYCGMLEYGYPDNLVFRYDGGTTWTGVGSMGPEQEATSMIVYNQKLYAAANPEAVIYRYEDNDTWTLMTVLGAVKDGDDWSVWTPTGEISQTFFVNSLAVYEGRLYSGTGIGGKVYVYNGTAVWPDVGGLDNDTSVTALAAYNGKLYGGTDSGGVYRYDGGANWTEISGGIGGAKGHQNAVRALVVHDGKLYVGAGAPGSLYAYDGAIWKNTGRLDDEAEIRSMETYDGDVYIGTSGGSVFKYGGESGLVEKTPEVKKGMSALHQCNSNADCEAGTQCHADIHFCVQLSECVPIINSGDSKYMADVVFVGDGYGDNEELKKDVLKIVDYDGIANGMMSVEPFLSNKQKFNIWMVNDKTPIPSDEWGWPERENSLDAASRCSMAEYSVLLSEKTFRSYAYFSGDAYLSLASEPEKDWGRLFLHEFGHSFGKLADEYVEPSKGDWLVGGSFQPPNCVRDVQIAQSLWGDLPETGYYRGCSYVESNIRATQNSIMKAHWIREYDYGPVNVRAIKIVLEKVGKI